MSSYALDLDIALRRERQRVYQRQYRRAHPYQTRQYNAKLREERASMKQRRWTREWTQPVPHHVHRTIPPYPWGVLAMQSLEVIDAQRAGR